RLGHDPRLLLPRVEPRSREARFERRGARRIGEERARLLDPRRHVADRSVERGVAAHFPQGRDVAREDRRSAGERLGDGEAEALALARLEDERGALVERRELGARDPALLARADAEPLEERSLVSGPLAAHLDERAIDARDDLEEDVDPLPRDAAPDVEHEALARDRRRDELARDAVRRAHEARGV